MLNELQDMNLLKAQYGGCRARAYAYFGDYLASDSGCPWVTMNGKVINPEGMKNAV